MHAAHAIDTDGQVWTGRTHRAGRWDTMHFANMKLDQNGFIYGSGIQKAQKFTFEGKTEPNGDVHLRKHYVGKHDVVYTGKINDHGEITGTWVINLPNCKENGRFELICKQKKWKGHYLQNGTKHIMAFGVSINNGYVSGYGLDEAGSFYVMGSYNENEGKVSFVKQYYGKHAVEYNGKHTKKGKVETIEGQWSIPGSGIWDTFCLEYGT